MRRTTAMAAMALCLLASRAEAKTVDGRFGLGGGVSVPGGTGEITLTYAMAALDLILGLDFDLGKAAGDDTAIRLGANLGIFWKPLQSEAINAGLQAGFGAAVARFVVGGMAADPIFHPALFIGFRADWFPEQNNNFAFYTSVDLVFNFVPADGAVLGDPVNPVSPGADGFSFGMGPNLSLGFRYFFGN